jgi:hypothetical protein
VFGEDEERRQRIWSWHGHTQPLGLVEAMFGVIGPIVGTSNSIDNFDRWINLGGVSSN